MDNLANILQKVGVGRILALVGGVMVMVVLFSMVFQRVNEAPLTLLYGGLNIEEAQQISNLLTTENIAHDLRAGGSAVYVPADQVVVYRVMKFLINPAASVPPVLCKISMPAGH